MRPRLLDLFCGAGGAAMGYHLAGFDVVGVDINPQKNYPFEFHQADAMTYPLDGFDAIHASPPCQAYSRLKAMWPEKRDAYPDLVGPTRERLHATGVPYVIENVPGAPLVDPLLLCGTMFGLGARGMDLRRHRLFETNFFLPQYPCLHDKARKTIGVYGHGGHSGKHRMANAAEAREALGIGWMNRDEMTQSIPPAYTQWIGERLITALEVAA